MGVGACGGASSSVGGVLAGKSRRRGTRGCHVSGLVVAPWVVHLRRSRSSFGCHVADSDVAPGCRVSEVSGVVELSLLTSVPCCLFPCVRANRCL